DQLLDELRRPLRLGFVVVVLELELVGLAADLDSAHLVDLVDGQLVAVSRVAPLLGGLARDRDRGAENDRVGRAGGQGGERESQLVYTESGYVSVQFMRRGRKPWKREDEPTDAERARCARGYGAYAGRFTVDAKAGIVRHEVQTALIPNRVGVTLTRAFSIEG